MLNKTLTSALAGSALVLGLAFAGSSQAALLQEPFTLNDCPSDFITDGTAKVHDGGSPLKTAADACQYIDPPQTSSVASLQNVNLAGFFGHSDWEVWDGKLQVETNDQSSGTWNLGSTANFTKNTYMITFKDGANTNLVSFKLNGLYTSGGWNTPFTSPPFSVGVNGQDVSHYSIFFKDKGVTVPEPATLGMLGLGLIGMAAIRRRKLGLKS